jgi:ubiquinone/menaquinone biosynthesis C-methylase UbiE
VINLWWRLVRFGFRLLYNEMAFTYDLVSNIVSLGAWRCWQRTALKHLHVELGKRVLEIAHGTGNLQLDLREAGYRSIGYDLSPYMGRIAKSKLIRHGYAPNLIRGKAQQLPFSTTTFAAVISTFPTDFIVQAETLREVHRILEPAGQFIIVPNGVLTGGGVSGAGIEWLYRVTGQRGDTSLNIADFFAAHGFDAQMISEQCPRSVAQVIVARKRG